MAKIVPPSRKAMQGVSRGRSLRSALSSLTQLAIAFRIGAVKACGGADGQAARAPWTPRIGSCAPPYTIALHHRRRSMSWCWGRGLLQDRVGPKHIEMVAGFQPGVSVTSILLRWWVNGLGDDYGPPQRPHIWSLCVHHHRRCSPSYLLDGRTMPPD